MEEKLSPIETESAEAMPAAEGAAPESTEVEIVNAEDAGAEEAAPEIRKVFGMPYHIFQGAALGFALGLILCGLIGIFIKEGFTSYLLIIGCAALGGWLAKRFFHPI